MIYVVITREEDILVETDSIKKAIELVEKEGKEIIGISPTEFSMIIREGGRG
jgi:hypothetical protein